MTFLQFLLFELSIKLVLKRFNLSHWGCLVTALCIPLWLVYGWFFSLEIIPFNHNRFEPLPGLVDYMILILIWTIGFILLQFLVEGILFLLLLLEFERQATFFIVPLFLLCLAWGWVGFYSTPLVKNRAFVKPNPSFHLRFHTRFDPPLNWGQLQEHKSDAEYEEEIRFMQYVRP